VQWQRRPAITRSVDDGVIVAPPTPGVEPVLLTGPGPLIWDLLAEPWTTAQLGDVLGEHFTGETDQLHADVRSLVECLGELGLVAAVTP
jgi:hypothetical protein